MATKFRHEDVATVPRGYTVRTRSVGAHQVRVAYPPGARNKGSGKLISILHPKRENPRRCRARNPIAEAIAGGLAAGTAVVAAQKLLKNRKRNQSAAAQLYKDFHGRAPSEVLVMQEALLKAGDYTVLGDMGSLWLEAVKGEPSHWPVPDIEFEPSDRVKLATDAPGKQLYLVGGNQTLPLSYLEKHGVSTDRRFISLGEVFGISYRTAKTFDGFNKMEYAHEFGENTGERPFAYYDSELKRIVLVGGGYSIAGVDDPLGASPGIVN